MSLQDDIFDVAAVLKKKPEAKSFERLINHFNIIEQELDDARDLVNSLRAGMKAFKTLLEDS